MNNIELEKIIYGTIERFKAMKNALGILALVLSLAMLLSSCSRHADDSTTATYRPGEEVRKIAVEGMAVTKSLLVNEIRGSGISEGVREAWVVSETEGLIRAVRFSLGDRVRQGQILATVDAELALRNRDLAVQQYNTAKLEFEAAEKSRQNGSISQLQYSQITDRLYAADAGRAAAMDNYENTILKAPFDGAVASRDRTIVIGNYLARGIRVARIIDDTSFRAEISVGEGQVLLIGEGSAAKILGNDGRTRNGRVSAVSAGSESRSGSYTVVVQWNPEKNDRLRSGMSVDVVIGIEGTDAAVVIPASSVRGRSGKDYVFVDEDGTAVLKEVKLGSRLGDRVEVFSGLEVGETLITSGISSLSSGIPVGVTLVGNSGDAS
jgi:membrane fusion protein (multidrug efflux system)